MAPQSAARGRSGAVALTILVLWLVARLWPLIPDPGLRQLEALFDPGGLAGDPDLGRRRPRQRGHRARDRADAVALPGQHVIERVQLAGATLHRGP